MPFTRKILTSIAVAAAIFFVIALWANWKEMVAALASFRWWTLPICLLLAFGNYVVRFFKWHYYVRILRIPLDRTLSLKVFFSGLLMSVSPGKFGEVFKSFLVKESVGTPISRSAPIVLAERFTDFVALAIMSLLGLAILPKEYRFLLWIAFGIIALTLVLVAWRSAMFRLIDLMAHVPGFSSRTDKLHNAYQSVYSLIAPRPLMWATAISIGSWFFECLAFAGVRKSAAASSGNLYLCFRDDCRRHCNDRSGGNGTDRGSNGRLLVLPGSFERHGGLRDVSHSPLHSLVCRGRRHDYPVSQPRLVR
jgi:uncharacterized protein (TIRG00374 family)